MDSDGEATGKAGVRQYLLARMDEAGMIRPKGVSEAAHAAMFDRLAAALSHMTPENLQTLADLVLDHGQGPARNVCPSEVVIRGMGLALQKRPPEQHRIITSWLRSVQGPEAEAGGYLVELYQFLCRRCVPPGDFDMIKIREEADLNNRRRTQVADWIRRGVAGQDKRDWLEGYLALERAAQALVDAGRAGRAGRAAHQGEAA